MSKAVTRSGTGSKRNTRKVTFYRRNRRIIMLGAVVASAVAIFVLLRSGGGSQIASGAFTGGDFHSLVVDPNNPNRIFAGGHEAVSVSIDGGKSWRQVPSLENRDAMGWGFAGSTVYVSGHPGLSVSSDGGQVFKERNANLPSTDLHAFGVGEGILYEASPGVGFFASTDGGNSWRVINTEKGHSFFGRILVDPADPEHVIAADARAGSPKAATVAAPSAPSGASNHLPGSAGIRPTRRRSWHRFSRERFEPRMVGRRGAGWQLRRRPPSLSWIPPTQSFSMPEFTMDPRSSYR